jgi:hypothetical protein
MILSSTLFLSVEKIVIITFALILEILFERALLNVSIGQSIEQQISSHLFIFVTGQISLGRFYFTES